MKNCEVIDLRPLSSATVEDLRLDPSRSNEHFGTAGPELSKLLKTLEIGSGDSILDLGCGKGTALIAMADFPFAQIAGCDISPELIQVARENLCRLGIHRIQLYCVDAAMFLELDDFTHFYLFNPFPMAVIEAVLKNIQYSIAKRPRRVTIIYRNPVCHSTIVAARTFSQPRQFCYTDKPYFVYTSTGDATASRL